MTPSRRTASVVATPLASRNETFWGEQKVYMRKNPNTNPNPKPRPPSNPISTYHHHHPANPKNRLQAPPSSYFEEKEHHAAVGSTHRSDDDDDAPPPAPAISDDSSSFSHHKSNGGLDHHHRKEHSSGRFATFNIASSSRRELRELKKRLISELEQVSSLSRRIEDRFQSSARSTGCVASAGSCYDAPPKEKVVVAPQPPALLTRKDKVASPRISKSHKQQLSGSKRPLPTVLPLAAVAAAAAKQPGDASGSHKLLSGMMKKCDQILSKLMKHKFGWVFNSPVDAAGLGLHDYHQIIKHPMDLGTVISRLKKNLYSSPSEFAADVRLTFNNALTYNPVGHDVHDMAQQLLSLFNNMFGEAHKRFEKQKRCIAREEEEERQRISTAPREEATKRAAASPALVPSTDIPARVPALSNVLPVPPPVPAPPLPHYPVPAPVQPAAAPPPKRPPPLVGKLPKPKAKDPNKREMTFEEKNKLVNSLQDLPQEKMDQMIHIVRRRNPGLGLHGDEIELDIEALDTETLWELDRFIYNCKKTMSKMRRQEEALSGAAANAVGDKEHPPEEEVVVDETAPEAAAAAEKNKKVGDVGDEEVDIGEQMPSTSFPPVEIEKDNTGGGHGGAGGAASSSSSSGSSSNSSSSSDSDSGSSSGSDSDSDDGQSPAVGTRPD